MDKKGTNNGRLNVNKPEHPLLVAAIRLSLVLGLVPSASNASFPSEIELGDLDGSDGFIVNGEFDNDFAGRWVSAAGDINADGIADFAIGAIEADPNAINNAGRSYVVFGSSSARLDPFNLSDLDGMNGFALDGDLLDSSSGWSISGAGDINNDGIDDVIIGAPFADADGVIDSGRGYVVFGAAGGLANPFDLGSLNGSNGFVMDSESAEARLGVSVSHAGDINGDGIDDVVISAPEIVVGTTGEGRSYVVFGQSSFSNVFNLSSLDGSNGIRIIGENVGDFAGHAVSNAGDFNGDGFDDLIIGAYGFQQGIYNSTGRGYVVFGGGSLPGTINLTDLDGTNGFAIDAGSTTDFFAISVSGAGDVNGDGFDDVIIGADNADSDGQPGTGRAYVVYGASSGIPDPLDINTLDGLNGLTFNGEAFSDRLGRAVSGAGDINSDGIDDLIVGDFRADFEPGNQGRCYVVFGRHGGLSNPFNLSLLDGGNGFKLNAEGSIDQACRAVSNAGDVNNDGIDDVIIGAQLADTGSGLRAGRSYIVYGRPSLDLSISNSNRAPYVDTGVDSTWFIEVRNVGDRDAFGARLINPIPSGVETASWTCTGFGGAVCPNSSGTGAIEEEIDLPIGAQLNYEWTATITAIEPETVTNSATINLAEGLVELNPLDNTASDTDPVALFADSSEVEL